MSSEVVLYYFYHKELCTQEIIISYKLLPSVIEVVYGESMTIVDLRSSVNGKGYATALLVYASKEAVRRGITVINLDDCSDKWRKPYNIYTKVGFEYVDEYGPEMTGDPLIISKYPTVTNLPYKIFRLVSQRC